MEKQSETKDDGTLCFKDRIWVTKSNDISSLVLDEAYKTMYSVHLGYNKIYLDLKKRYWWPNQKAKIATYVSKCLTYAKVKAEHQKTLGSLQKPEIPKWKW